MREVIDKQENSHLDGAIAKKEVIIGQAEDQNAEYRATIADLDR